MILTYAEYQDHQARKHAAREEARVRLLRRRATHEGIIRRQSRLCRVRLGRELRRAAS